MIWKLFGKLFDDKPKDKTDNNYQNYYDDYSCCESDRYCSPALTIECQVERERSRRGR